MGKHMALENTLQSFVVKEVTKMSVETDVIKVAVSAAEKILVHATGNPATVVAVGVAAAAIFVGTGVGYGLYKGGGYLLDWMIPKKPGQ